MYFSDKPSGANKDKFNKLLIMLNTADADMQTEVSVLQGSIKCMHAAMQRSLYSSFTLLLVSQY